MRKYKYDVSIIIPIYNTEKYIDQCIESIIKQSYDFNKIQLILINDGSKDNSLAICQKYGSMYKNIYVVDQKNSGVSKTRNKGLDMATGKYIMFVDADDFLSKNTIKILYKLMEKNGNEVDLYTYPRYSFDNNSKEIKLITRYTNYKKNCLFDINDTNCLIQPTLNVIIKNKFKKNEKFDEKLFFHEDEEYITKIIMKKKKFGYAATPKYYYRNHDASTTNNKSNPYYCFNNYIGLYEQFIKKYSKNGKLPIYIQRLIFNDIKWRIKDDVFYPYHLQGKEKDKAYARIDNIFKYIDVHTIINDDIGNQFHKVYYLKLKKADFSYKITKNKYYVYADKELLAHNDKMLINISKFKVFNNILSATMNIRDILLEILSNKEKPTIYLNTIDNDNNIDKLKLNLFKSNYCEFKSKIKTNDFYGFHLKIDLANVKSFYITVEIGNQEFPTYFTIGNECSFRVRRKYLICQNQIIHIEKKGKYNYCFNINHKNTFNTITALTINNLKTIFAHPSSIYNRLILKDYNNKRKIWLYNDNMVSFDNAYYQFLHDLTKDDGIERYYVFFGSKKEAEEKFSKDILKNIIYYNSKEHRILFLNSSKIISSFNDKNIYSPFKDKNYYYNDLLNYEFIYLQHGILHAYMPWEYSNEKNNEFNRVVISTKFEKENFINKYNYSPEQLIDVGMPRLDNLNTNTQKKNKILYAPSWRKNLVGAFVNGEWQSDEEKFLESKFFKETSKFLNSKELQKILEKNNLILEFKNHPIFEKYNKLYKIKNKNVKIVSGNTKNDEYKLVITDYSSFVFDYVYLKTPILYFVPDLEMFVAGVTHHYKKLDLPLEKGFGPIAYTTKDLINNIEKYTNDNFNLSPIYAERYDNFFFRVDNRKEALYEEILKI